MVLPSVAKIFNLRYTTLLVYCGRCFGGLLYVIETVFLGAMHALRQQSCECSLRLTTLNAVTNENVEEAQNSRYVLASFLVQRVVTSRE